MGKLGDDGNWVDGCFEWYQNKGGQNENTKKFYLNQKTSNLDTGDYGGNRVCAASAAPPVPPPPPPAPPPPNNPVVIGNGKAPAPPADTPAPRSADLQPKYTQEVGGDGGSVCEDKCPAGAYITHWKLRTGSLVDSIMGLCTNGQWLKYCGGTGGNAWEGDGDAHSIPVRSGSMIDKFLDQGGNGGNYATLDCGAGYKIGGYKTAADNDVLFKLSLYCVPSASVTQAPPASATVGNKKAGRPAGANEAASPVEATAPTSSGPNDAVPPVEATERQKQEQAGKTRSRSRDGAGDGDVITPCKATVAWADSHLDWCPWGGWEPWATSR